MDKDEQGLVETYTLRDPTGTIASFKGLVALTAALLLPEVGLAAASILMGWDEARSTLIAVIGVGLLFALIFLQHVWSRLARPHEVRVSTDGDIACVAVRGRTVVRAIDISEVVTYLDPRSRRPVGIGVFHTGGSVLLDGGTPEAVNLIDRLVGLNPAISVGERELEGFTSIG
jgi:hypothetical protein